MESAIAIYKLIILYLLDLADEEIAMTQVTNFLIENAYVNFESLVSTYEEIRENGFIEEHESGDVMFLRITQEGRQTVRMFKDQLSPEIRSKVRQFLTDNGRKLREERSVVAEYYKASYGGYTAHLAVREEEKELYSVNLNMPDEASARAIAKKFREKSADVYGAVIEQLL